MKIRTPGFSDRYKAHVEAERQYVLNTQQEDTPISGNCGGLCEKRTYPTAPSIEEAFHSVRKENKNSNPVAFPRKTETES